MATVNKDFRIKNGLVVEGATGTINGEDIITTGFTTDSLDEGTTNQYFTDARAKDSAASLLTSATLTNITITGNGSGLTITAENGVGDATTDDLTEGVTNLYYTDSRVKSVIDSAIDNGSQTNISVTYDAETNALSFVAERGIEGATTDDIGEGVANLYFTDERAVNAVINGAVDTDDIEEGTTNLYFTSERALSATASAYDPAGSAATAQSNAASYTDTAIANLVDSAPETLDTLNELAAALGDDPNFATTIMTEIGGKVSKSGDTMTGELVLSGAPTTDLAAATKKYVDEAESSALSSANSYADTLVASGISTATPQYLAIDVNDVAKQVASTISGTAATPATAYSFSKLEYRSAKFLVKIAAGTNTEVSEVLLTLDTSDNVAITEYAVVSTNSSMSSISATVVSNSVNLVVTPVGNATISVYGTLIV